MIDDKYLFAAVASSDEKAFKTVFEHFRHSVYSAAFRWTRSVAAAEDITQDVFIKLWESRHLLASVTYPRAYIYKATFNRTKNYLRSSQLRSKATDQLAGQRAVFSNPTLEILEAKEFEQRITAAVGQLSEQKQTIYNLSKKEGKSYKEIADYLKISPETVRSHLYETMKYIRHYLKRDLVVGLLLLLLQSLR
jgi:RNA polymerase sigma-70 factor (ECF subfamily)